jgi:hypothetical protein
LEDKDCGVHWRSKIMVMIDTCDNHWWRRIMVMVEKLYHIMVFAGGGRS